MPKSESIQEFHQRNNLAFTPAAWGSGPPRHALGQINVFRRQDLGCRAATPYNRRDYYKISLVIGQGVLHYADKSILIDRDALLFSNPNIPYSWEALSEKQCGFFTLFTQDFISRTESLQDSTLFRIGSEPVMFVDETQKSFYHDIFTRMLAEIESEYVHKYDVLRNYVNLLLHEAMKTQRGNITYSHPNAATRYRGFVHRIAGASVPHRYTGPCAAPEDGERLCEAYEHPCQSSQPCSEGSNR